jgi:hypothetical protein
VGVPVATAVGGWFAGVRLTRRIVPPVEIREEQMQAVERL